MKFTVDRDILADAVAWAARALPQRPPVPVLAGLRLLVHNGVLALSSFDYEVSARVEVTAEIDDPGTVLVSGKLLAEISRLLPNKPVSVVLEGPKVVLTCGNSTFTLLTMPLDDYPALPQMPDVVGTVDSDIFAEAVGQVFIAASKDETLPLLTGVRMEIEEDKVSLLATDRYRLAIRELTWNPLKPDISTVALVRARTLVDAAKSFGHAEKISLSLSAGEAADIIGFEAAGRRSTSLLVDGDFPPVRKLIPESSPMKAVVSVADLIESTRRVALVAERNAPIRISLFEGQAVLDAGAGDDAQASETIDCTFEGDPIVVAFNPQYLLDGLGVLGTPYVKLALSHPNKPVLFTGMKKPDGEEVTDYQYLLVPIRFAS